MENSPQYMRGYTYIFTAYIRYNADRRPATRLLRTGQPYGERQATRQPLLSLYAATASAADACALIPASSINSFRSGSTGHLFPPFFYDTARYVNARSVAEHGHTV